MRPTMFFVSQKSPDAGYERVINNGLNTLTFSANKIVDVEHIVNILDGEKRLPPRAFTKKHS